MNSTNEDTDTLLKWLDEPATITDEDLELINDFLEF